MGIFGDGFRNYFHVTQLTKKFSPEYFQEPTTLAPHLNLYDLIGYGISLTIGAGIYVAIGESYLTAGPAVLISFILASISCILSGLCYGEFASRTKHAGSAYSFIFLSFGELPAFCVGWLMNLEFALASSIVARFSANIIDGALRRAGHESPVWILGTGSLSNSILSFSPVPLVIVSVSSLLMLLNIKISVRLAAISTVLNVVFLAIVAGLALSKYDAENYTNFAPYGVTGILKSASMCFFSFIGFDGIALMGAEAKRPDKDIKRSIIYTILAVTIIYLIFSSSIVGMVGLSEVNPISPIASAFTNLGLPWASTFIDVVSLYAILLVTFSTMLGQPRVFYQMAREGLIYRPLCNLDRRSVPLNASYLSIFIVAICSCLFDLDVLTNAFLASILISYGSVCAGSLILLLRTSDLMQEPLSYASWMGCEWLAKRLSRYITSIVVTFYLSTVAMSVTFAQIPDTFYFLIPLPIIILSMFAIFSLKGHNAPILFTNGTFPSVPMLAVIVNNILLGNKVINISFIWLIVYALIGIAVYFLYGHRNSILRDSTDK